MFFRFGRIEHNKDEVRGLGRGHDLSPTPAALTGALDDTWQIEQLYARSLVLQDARDRLKRCR